MTARYYYSATIASDPMQALQRIINNSSAEDISMYGMTQHADGIVTISFTSPRPISKVRSGFAFHDTTKIRYLHNSLVESFPDTYI